MPIRSKKCGTFCLTLLHPVTTFYKTNISYLPYMSFFQGRMVPLCLLTMDDIYLEKKLFFWWDVRFTGWICPRTPPKFLGMQLNSRWCGDGMAYHVYVNHFVWNLKMGIHKQHLTSKELHGLAGNSMAVRAITAVICAAISVTDPTRVANLSWDVQCLYCN